MKKTILILGLILIGLFLFGCTRPGPEPFYQLNQNDINLIESDYPLESFANLENVFKDKNIKFSFEGYAIEVGSCGCGPNCIPPTCSCDDWLCGQTIFSDINSLNNKNKIFIETKGHQVKQGTKYVLFIEIIENYFSFLGNNYKLVKIKEITNKIPLNSQVDLNSFCELFGQELNPGISRVSECEYNGAAAYSLFSGSMDASSGVYDKDKNPLFSCGGMPHPNSTGPDERCAQIQCLNGRKHTCTN